LLLALILSTGTTATVSAHKIVVFAAVQGTSIEGEVYLQGGEPLANIALKILAPDGETLGETRTDAAGKFRYEPRLRCAHRVIADAGMGHQAEYIVPQEELPADLPLQEVGESRAQETPGALGPHAKENHAHGGGPAHDSDSVSAADQDASAEIRALNQQIAALRVDLQRWKSRLRLQDIMGGIGYILGILGVWSYFFARRDSRDEPSLNR
jgi:nickel transport protein